MTNNRSAPTPAEDNYDEARDAAEEDASDRLIVTEAATAEASIRYQSRLIEDYDGDRFTEDEYGYDATARQAFVAGALWYAGMTSNHLNLAHHEAARQLVELARKQFREDPLTRDLGVAPDSVMDVHRRLADIVAGSVA